MMESMVNNKNVESRLDAGSFLKWTHLAASGQAV